MSSNGYALRTAHPNIHFGRLVQTFRRLDRRVYTVVTPPANCIQGASHRVWLETSVPES